MRSTFFATFLLFAACLASAQSSELTAKRARAWGIPFDGVTGDYNAITDVPGVLVGYKTIISGSGKLVKGKGPVRTGVTVVLPKGHQRNRFPAGMFSLNGDGEFTGSHYINDYGTLPTAAIGITNTNSVGVVRDAIGAWQIEKFSDGGLMDFSFGLPVVGETWDGDFNDINGLHINRAHVMEAISSAKSEAIAEGNVGGGTGMWLYGFKGGTGTSSRVFTIDSIHYTVGVLLQANFGEREELTIAGVKVGREITDLQPVFKDPRKDGSLIVIVATDAPLLPDQLRMVAKRVSLGVARTGTISGNGSGDIFLAFSTNDPEWTVNQKLLQWNFLPKWKLDEVFRATVQATEEAIINALFAAETMKGIDDNIMYECPEEKVVEILKKYNRIPGKM